MHASCNLCAPITRSGLEGYRVFRMITEFSFGRMAVNGQICNSDIKIVAGKLVSDWWRKSGHLVEIEDVQDILNVSPEVLVIGTGAPGYMRMSDALRRRLEENNIELIVEPTARAVETFNRLSKEGRRVCAGFHVGC